MASLIPPVVLKASARHTATMIFLHGLGDTGLGWSGALNTIRPPHLKLICPTAPIIPVTLNGGAQMPAWYDIISLDPEDPVREDMEGVELAYKNLKGLIDAEAKSVSRERIVIGGFSQGGAIALFTTLREKERLGGCIALSTYIPGHKVSPPPPEDKSCRTPVLQCHGDADTIVPFSRGEQTRQILQKAVDSLEFKAFPHMGHEANQEELDLVKDFITKHIPHVN